MRGEISYDLVMEDEMRFIEGTYRLPGRDWQVVIFVRRDVPEAQVRQQTWESGVTGVLVRFPRNQTLNKGVAEQVLSAALGVTEWVQVRGPDSMQLR